MAVRSWKVPMGRVRRRTSRKRRSSGLVGGAHGLTLRKAWRAHAGEQVGEVGAQTGHGLGIGVLPAVGEAAGGGACLGQRLGVHDPVQAALEGRLVGLADLVEHVADLVRPSSAAPAPLDRP
jgi:hypothetical protein